MITGYALHKGQQKGGIAFGLLDSVCSLLY